MDVWSALLERVDMIGSEIERGAGGGRGCGGEIT